RERGTQPAIAIESNASPSQRNRDTAGCGRYDGDAMIKVPMNGKLEPGLYIVATPIGNLSDLSPRAAETLAHADLLAVEDSRVTAKLLHHIGVKRPMLPYHDHNADRVRPGLIERMAREAVALVSDAGTPLISDPGYKLVRDARAA